MRPDISDVPARILIVDDEPYNREVLSVMLTPEHLQVRTADSGQEALDMVAVEAPDLILLDVMMPGMDGNLVVAALKRDPVTRHIPVIMVTALNDRAARMLALDAGAEDFLTKPVDRADVCARVRNLLRLKAYGDHYDSYSQALEGQVLLRMAALVERTKLLDQQAAALTEQAALLDLAQDAIVVRDMNHRIQSWNRGAEFMYGWTSEDAVGTNAFELLQTELPEPLDTIQAALLRDNRWQGEAIQHVRDGTRAIVDSRWALQRGPDGEALRVLSIDNDITERKHADVQLRGLTEREHTSQEQMRFKDEFLSHVSHELRSPLTAIKQFTTILLGGLAGRLNDAQREYQQIVLKNVGQLQSMIDDLLEVTQLETGQLSVALETTSLGDAVRDTLDTLRETARAKDITVLADLPSDLPAVRADRTRLRQILIILIDNAIKFTNHGGAVTIRADRFGDDPRFLLIDVRDTGCGISPTACAHIFERLYQGDQPAQAGRKGLGLGLYICRQLVTRHGGRIWVTSHPGQGSTFSLTLPVSSPSDGAPTGAPPDASIDVSSNREGDHEQ
jgi:PAS domain S-box-containing protein